MIKLMKLELKKLRLGWYLNAAVIANIVIVLLMSVIGFVESMEGQPVFTSRDEVFIVIGAFVRSTFIVLAAVLISKLIIEEYKNKTILMLFMYPISRKKLLVSKLLLIVALTFTAIVISNIFTLTAFLGINVFLEIVPNDFSAINYQAELLRIVNFAFAAAGTSLIPLYFGMRKYSVPATIVSSLLLVALTSSHNPVISLASIIYIPLGLAIIGVLLAWWAIRHIETTDIV